MCVYACDSKFFKSFDFITKYVSFMERGLYQGSLNCSRFNITFNVYSIRSKQQHQNSIKLYNHNSKYYRREKRATFTHEWNDCVYPKYVLNGIFAEICECSTEWIWFSVQLGYYVAYHTTRTLCAVYAIAIQS